MKKNFMTRVLAVAMSAAMALSMATATNLTVAEAATAKMASKSFTVRVGGKAKSYKATKATQKAYKITKAKAGNTDKATVKISSTGKSIKVTPGSKTGKTTITLTFKNRSTKATETVKFTGKVLAEKTAEQAIKEIKQTALDTIEVTLAAAPATVAATDFSVKRETVNTSNQNVVVKSATADKTDAKKITLVVYGKLNDAATYDVAYTSGEKTVTGQFVATDGTVAKIEVTPTTVTAGKETLLYYVTFDKDGIQLDKQKVNANVDSKVEIADKVTSGSGYITETSKVYLASVGDTMEVTATYHTYKYDGATEVGAITSTTTITAVENATTIAAVPYTITKYAIWNWNKITPVTTIAVGDTDKYLRMLVTKNDGSLLTATDEYTVESSDASIFVVDGNAASDNIITPVGVGSAYALIKDSKGTVVYSLPISVVAARHLERVILSKTSMIVSTDPAVKYASDKTVATAYDQYNEVMTSGYAISAECVGRPSEETTEYATILSTMIDSSVAGTFAVETAHAAAGLKKGVYTFKVVATDTNTGVKRQQSFTVTRNNTMATTDSLEILLTPNASDAYAATSFDTAASSTVLAPQTLTIYAHLVVKNNGVVKNNTIPTTSSVGAVTVKKNGVVIAATGVGITKKVTCAAINNTFGTNVGKDGQDNDIVTLTAVSSQTVDTVAAQEKWLEPGTYTIEAVVYDANSKKTTVTKQFTIADTEAETKIQVLKTAVDAQSMSHTNEKIFTYSYDGVDLISYATGEAAVDTKYVKQFTFAPSNAYEYKTDDLFVKAKNTFVVKKAFVTIALPVAGATEFTTGTLVRIPVTVNKNFTYYGSDANSTAWGIA